MKRGVPDRGDVLHVALDPTLGREQAGKRYVLVLTTAELNRFGLAMVCPITQGGQFDRMHGFAVSLTGAGTHTQGIVQCHQVRTISYKERGAAFIEALPIYLVDEVLARVRALLA